MSLNVVRKENKEANYSIIGSPRDPKTYFGMMMMTIIIIRVVVVVNQTHLVL